MAMVGRWLVKTEPEEWSWEHQQANGGVSQWDGVRNAQAQKHMRAMAEGDLCFFYHSGPKAKEIVGIARVCKTFYPDPSDSSSKHGMVDIEAVSKLDQPLSLARLKQDDRLHSFILFRQTRLSVVPVSISEWDVICELAEVSKPPNRVDEEVKGEGGSCDILHTDFTMEVSRTMDLAADTKKVYSRRIKKERQLDSLSPNAEVTDSGVVVSDPGRVYKRRHRKQRSVDSLSR